MTALHDLGISVILVLQTVPWLETTLRFFSLIGTSDFFILFLPILYWCVDAGLGIRVAFILLFSNSLNEILKLALHGPRPYWINSQVKALAAESSFGAPSGHAEIAVGVWGIVAARIRRRWAWIAFAVVVFLIGLSRVYLAVHFPADVILGWLLGGLTLWAFLALWKPVSQWVQNRSFLEQGLLAAGTSLLMILLDGLLTLALRGYVLPTDWMTNAARAGQPLPDPLSMESILTASGAFFGLALGLAWLQPRGGYQPSGPVWKRGLCFAVGLLGSLILYLGLRYVIPSSSTLVGSVFRFARYAAIGAWVSAGAPFAFYALQLVPRQRHV